MSFNGSIKRHLLDMGKTIRVDQWPGANKLSDFICTIKTNFFFVCFGKVVNGSLASGKTREAFAVNSKHDVQRCNVCLRNVSVVIYLGWEKSSFLGLVIVHLLLG